MKMVRVGPAPGFKPAPAQAETWAKIKGEQPKTLAYVTAMENVKLSGGMYAILPDEGAQTVAVGVRMPEDMTRDELVLTALQLGVDMSKKQMKKAELAKAVRLAMEKVALLEDDEDEGQGAA